MVVLRDKKLGGKWVDMWALLKAGCWAKPSALRKVVLKADKMA